MAGRRQAGLELTKAQAIALLGTTGRTFDRRVQEGVYRPLKRGRSHQPATFDGVALVAADRAHREAQRPALDLQAERAALARAQREKLDLEMEVRRGELVPRRAAEEVWKGHVLRARARLLQLPAQARVRGVAAAAVAIFNDLVRGALEALAASGDEEDDEV